MPPSSARVQPLSPDTIESLVPGRQRYELGDPGAPGLRLRVGPSSKTFIWYARDNAGRLRSITLGPWSYGPRAGHLTIHEARQELEELKRAHRARRLGEAVEDLRRRLGGGTSSGTVAGLLEEWLALRAGKRSYEEIKRTVQRDIVPRIGDLRQEDVRPRDLGAVVERVALRGSPAQASAVLSVLRSCFRWAYGSGRLTSDPAHPLREASLGARKGSRERVLTEREIRALWAHTGTTWTALKVLLLTGLRTQEWRLATWAAIDGDVLYVPPEHMKVPRSRPWPVPLTPGVLALLETLPRRSGWVFGGKRGPLTRTTLYVAAARAQRGEADRWTPHDLRRTCRSGLSALGTPDDIAERVLGHALPGVRGVYDRDDRIDDRRAAQLRWEARVLGLVV